MPYEIILAPQAVQDFGGLKAHLRAAVREAIERHLRHQPTRTGRSRIKRLQGFSRPQFRFRVGDVRIFYDDIDIIEKREVLAVIHRDDVNAWLDRESQGA